MQNSNKPISNLCFESSGVLPSVTVSSLMIVGMETSLYDIIWLFSYVFF